MADPTEPSIAEIGWRLTALERTVGKLESHVAEGFMSVSAQISSLTFVNRDVYAAHQATVADNLKAVKAIAEDAKATARLAVQMVGGTAIGAIVTGLVLKANGG